MADAGHFFENFGEIAERERETIYENVLSLPEENSILVITCGMWQAGEI